MAAAEIHISWKDYPILLAAVSIYLEFVLCSAVHFSLDFEETSINISLEEPTANLNHVHTTLGICRHLPPTPFEYCIDSVGSIVYEATELQLSSSATKKRHVHEEKASCLGVPAGAPWEQEVAIKELASILLKITEDGGRNDNPDKFFLSSEGLMPILNQLFGPAEVYEQIQGNTVWEKLAEAVSFLVDHHKYRSAFLVAEYIVTHAGHKTPTWAWYQWSRLCHFHPYRGPQTAAEGVLALELLLAYGNHTVVAKCSIAKQLAFFYEDHEFWNRAFFFTLLANDWAHQDQQVKLGQLNPLLLPEYLPSIAFSFQQALGTLQALVRGLEDDHRVPWPPPRGIFTPVFVVGPPRSGSTLLATILSAHSQVASVGESTCLPGVLDRFHLVGVRTVRNISATNVMDIREMYFDCILEESRLLGPEILSGGVTHIIDKNLANFVFLGIIGAFFPEAKVLQTTRSPLDNALSIFRQDFFHFCFSQTRFYEYDFGQTLTFIEQVAEAVLFWEHHHPLGRGPSRGEGRGACGTTACSAGEEDEEEEEEERGV
mmetsp:Transcript_9581/g.16887  ORF Transcript_9581/g.16887 Transcript_9581/m.16887 type:complete len:544 (+) Transcript_9581:45-1676(+)